MNHDEIVELAFDIAVGMYHLTLPFQEEPTAWDDLPDEQVARWIAAALISLNQIAVAEWLAKKYGFTVAQVKRNLLKRKATK